MHLKHRILFHLHKMRVEIYLKQWVVDEMLGEKRSFPVQISRVEYIKRKIYQS